MISTPPFSLSHFAIIPVHVAHAHVSERAKGLWRELALVAGPNRKEVWLRQASMAEKMGCSVSTIQRALKELLNAGLLCAKKRWHQGRHKVYSLVWRAAEAVKKILPKPTSVKIDQPPQSPATDHVSQICPDLNKEHEYNNNNNDSDAKPAQKKPAVVFLLESEKPTFEKLKANGIKGKVAIRLIAQHGAEICAKQLSHLAWQEQRGYKFKVGKTAWLCSAIRENWDLPNAMTNPKDTFADLKAKQDQAALKQVFELEKLSAKTTINPNNIPPNELERLKALANQKAKRDVHKFKSFGASQEDLAKEYLRGSLEERLRAPRIEKQHKPKGAAWLSKAKSIVGSFQLSH